MSTYAGVTSKIASQLGLGRASGERILEEIKRLQASSAPQRSREQELSHALAQVAAAVKLNPGSPVATIVDQVEFVQRKAVNNAGRSDSQAKFLLDMAEALGFGPEVPYVTVLAEVRRMAEDAEAASGFAQHMADSFDKLAAMVEVPGGQEDTVAGVITEVDRTIRAEAGLLQWQQAGEKLWAEVYEAAGLGTGSVSKGQLIEYVRALKRKQLSPTAAAMIASTLKAIIEINGTTTEQLQAVLEALK